MALPFGLVQDLLHKIPLFHKKKNLPGHRFLRYGKYLVLVVFVILLPMTVVGVTGMGDPWFCKYICPSGTLFGGLPLLASNPTLRAAAGWLFSWKTLLLVAIVLLSIRYYRPFCKYLCPLGALYGLFNPVSLYRLRVDQSECVHCGKCQQVCGDGYSRLGKAQQHRVYPMRLLQSQLSDGSNPQQSGGTSGGPLQGIGFKGK